MITFDTSVHCWAAVLRTSPDEPGVEIVGGHRTAVDSIGAALYLEALAGYLAAQAASKPYSSANHTVLIRSNRSSAISALQKGSFRFPALQDIDLLHIGSAQLSLH